MLFKADKVSLVNSIRGRQRDWKCEYACGGGLLLWVSVTLVLCVCTTLTAIGQLFFFCFRPLRYLWNHHKTWKYELKKPELWLSEFISEFIPYVYQFESWPLHFQFRSLLMLLGKAEEANHGVWAPTTHGGDSDEAPGFYFVLDTALVIHHGHWGWLSRWKADTLLRLSISPSLLWMNKSFQN